MLRHVLQGLIVVGLFNASLLLPAEAVFSKDAPKKLVKLGDLIQEALEHNPALRAAKFEAEAKHAEIGPAGSYEDPMIGFEAMNYPVDTFSANEFGMTGKQVKLSQKIPFPGKLGSKSRAVASEYFSKREEFNNKQLRLIKDVRVAYFEYYLAFRKRAILEEELKLIRDMIRSVRNEYTLGKIPQADVLRFQLEEADLTDKLLSADREITSHAGDLRWLLGRKGYDEIGIPEGIDKTAIDFSKLTEESLREKIIQKNPALKIAEHENQAASARLTAAKLGYLPDFEFGAGYTFRSAVPNERNVDFLSFSVGVSIPLWAFSKQAEEVNGAIAERNRSGALLEEEQLHLANQVHGSYAALVEAYKRLQLYESVMLPLSKQAANTARSAYSTRKLEYAGFLEVIRVRFQNEYAYDESLVNYESKIAEFEAFLGEPLNAQ